MDGANNLQGHQRMRHEQPHQLPVAEVAAVGMQDGMNERARGVPADNADGQRVAWRRDLELVPHVHVHERGYVELLGLALANDCVRRSGHLNRIAVTLTEGVMHLIDQRCERTVAPMTEVDTERVEGITENARHAEQTNRAACFVNTDLLELLLDLLAQRPLIVTVVLVIE